jgi:hypothetical protein
VCANGGHCDPRRVTVNAICTQNSFICQRGDQMFRFIISPVNNAISVNILTEDLYHFVYESMLLIC